MDSRQLKLLSYDGSLMTRNGHTGMLSVQEYDNDLSIFYLNNDPEYDGACPPNMHGYAYSWWFARISYMSEAVVALSCMCEVRVTTNLYRLKELIEQYKSIYEPFGIY